MNGFQLFYGFLLCLHIATLIFVAYQIIKFSKKP
jgi:hypothetical protein